jgi:hypothetical protein
MNEYLEIIELRTAGQGRVKVERVLEELIDGLKANTEREHIQVYKSLVVETDYCIHLQVLSDNASGKGSPLGLRIASTLNEYGLIYHNIWRVMTFRPLIANSN